ncbi:MAG: DUF938 domain-containing protein [Pseudomonadota bacterium]
MSEPTKRNPVALEKRQEAADGRRSSPSIARNLDPICAVFLKHMPTKGSILEIASGTGEHGYHLTTLCPDLRWTYSDVDPSGLVSQSAWRDFADHDRLLGPLALDASLDEWPTIRGHVAHDGMFCANMIHIAPFSVAEGLLTGAGRTLAPYGKLMIYGPFARRGEMAASNASFDADLKRRDPDWGVRDLEHDLIPLAERAGLLLDQVIDMPANNLSVIFRRLTSA